VPDSTYSRGASNILAHKGRSDRTDQRRFFGQEVRKESIEPHSIRSTTSGTFASVRGNPGQTEQTTQSLNATKKAGSSWHPFFSLDALRKTHQQRRCSERSPSRMMVPTLVSSSTMNIANWERATPMNNRRSNNGNDSSEDEFEGESHHNHSAPWHGVAPLEDPNLHPHHLHSHHRHFDYNQPPIVDTYPTPQHSLVPAATTPGTASSGASAALPFPSFGPGKLKQEEEEDNDDESDEDRKPAASEDHGGDKEEAKDPLPSHPRRNHSISNDPYVDPSVGLNSFDDDVDEGTHGPFGVAGYHAAEEYELQESAGFAYAAPAPMYAPPVRQAYPPPQRSNPHLSFVIGGGNRFDRQLPLQRARYSPATRAYANAVTSNPSVARLPSPPDNVARLPPPEEPRHRPALPRAAHHGFGPPAGGFQPTEAELSAAPTPRARKAIFTWYERLNELIEYREEHGDCVVPQKYEENRQLGIVSSALLKGIVDTVPAP